MRAGSEARSAASRRRGRLPPRALTLTLLLSLWFAAAPSLPAATATGSTVGYLGCSPTWQTVDGYHADGGTRLWPTLQGYGAGEIPKWYADLTASPQKYWPIFTKALSLYPTNVFWFQGCFLTAQIGPTNVRDAEAVINHIRELVPGAIIYFSPMGAMDPPDSCGKASPAAVARAQYVVDTAVADGLALRGPMMPPLPQTMTADPCHPNTEGKAFLGQTLLAWLGEAGPPPAPTFTQTPSDPSEPSVTFSFVDGESGATFACSLDGGPPTACASPDDLTGLPEGQHTFSVRAVDEAGNMSDPATFSWTSGPADTTPPPVPTFTQTPTDPSGPAVTFSFTDDEASATFTCSLDGSVPGVCTSPHDVAGLTNGSHTFSVRAVDGVGNVSEPATFVWTVASGDTTAPVVTMLKPTADAFLNVSKVTASWSGSDDRGIVRYDLYERVGTAGVQTLVQSSLVTSFSRAGVLGKTYCYQVDAYDASGNVGVGEERCTAVPYDDTDVAISYQGSTTRITSTNAFQKTLTVLNGTGQQASLAFTGRRVTVIVHKSPSSGKAAISIDGVVVATVDLYASSPKDGAPALSSIVPPGSHTVTIAWTGQKNTASTGTEVDLDAIGVISQ